MTESIDIFSDAPYPGGALSNFSDRPFEFDGVKCNSAESLLQSLKFFDVEKQRVVWVLTGRDAKSVGTANNEDWQASQTLWWRGSAMDRHGSAYQIFLDRVYQAIFDQSPDFRAALHATADAALTHSIGNPDPKSTVLTEDEFCARLLRLRQKLRPDGAAAAWQDRLTNQGKDGS